MARTERLNKEDPQSRPWYTYGWPWFLISLPLTSIALGALMLFLAINTNNSLVVDDYYKQGKAINLRIERDRVAALLGVRAGIRVVQEGLLLNVSKQTPTLPLSLQAQAAEAASGFSWPDSFRLRWVHIVDARLDGECLLRTLGGGRYIAQNIPVPANGQYRLHLEPVVGDRWRLVSVVVSLPLDQSLTMAAAAPGQVFSRDAFFTDAPSTISN